MATPLRENPFTPTFGEIPAYMAGREELLNNFRKAFSQTSRSPYLATLVTGARGTGKTALLSLAAQEAQARGWVSVSCVALPGLLDDVYVTARRAARHLVALDGGARIKGIGVGQMLNVEWEAPASEPSNWRSRMTDLIDALEEAGAGLLITVDEVQPSLDELIQLVAVYQLFVQENRKVALLMAGLPHNVLQLLQDKSVSFARRAQMVHLGRLSDYEVSFAMRRTIELSGRNVEDDALQELVEVAGGFPFMMQLVGFRAWDMNPQKDNLSLSDAREGANLARQELESRIVVPTYAALSSGDKRFLFAMANIGAPCSTADVGRAMGKSTSYAAQYKRRLLDQGVIGETVDGLVDFDIPMMREYVESLAK